MATVYVTGVEETEGDSLLFSRLLDELTRGLKTRCINLMRYDGTWSAPAETMPTVMSTHRKAQFEHLRAMSRLNLAMPIVNAVESRQRPNGFRKVNDETLRSTEANEAFMRNHLQLKIMQGNHDVALYGTSYLLVAPNGFGENIHYVDPWSAVVSQNNECGVIYTYDELKQVETFAFYRMLFNEQGELVRVYKKNATRKGERSLVLPDDKLKVREVAESSQDTHGWTGRSNFVWAQETTDYEYAVECHSLPLVQRRTPTRHGVLEPHWSTMDRINQKVFDQLVISMMQAFKQRAIKGMRPTYTDKDLPVIEGKAKAGDPINYEGMFEAGVGALWMLPTDIDIWESGYVDIQPLDSAITNDIKRLASTAGVPLDVLSPDVQGSAEGASLKRESLTFLVEQLNTLTNDALTRAITMSLVLDGNAQADVDLFEMMWLPADPQNIVDLANAASQLQTILAKKTIMKQVLGFTETQIQEALRDSMDELFTTAGNGEGTPTGANLDNVDLFNEQLPNNSGNSQAFNTKADTDTTTSEH
ncbi:hypothetical protein ACUXZ5_03145 [Alloscardovia omnicolens]|uniref:Phage portal protein n=2 Tax=Alloscardovia omnicolens TaxID=419015 RepID=A0A2I1M1J5_9BIFI|nr:hypothetical protein [Alloscardovia omnicolens]MDK6664345.1 hypothetical protein [Alloscardovia omnicolens]MDK7748703.1 hypothetical protein [Alloscardovia omnicolens]PKZ14001.1 hypothetical protein CYJ32_07630 [Alloscardovia omnicolens]